jgi:hypothetical protein
LSVLTDDARPDAGVSHPVGRLADKLVGQLVDRAAVDQRIGGVVRAAIPATAHDDVEAGRPRDTCQP